MIPYVTDRKTPVGLESVKPITGTFPVDSRSKGPFTGVIRRGGREEGDGGERKRSVNNSCYVDNEQLIIDK